MKLDDKGPYKAEVLEIDVKGLEVWAVIRTSYDEIVSAWGDAVLDIEDRSSLQAVGYITKLMISGCDDLMPEMFVDLVNRELEDYDWSEQVQDNNECYADYMYDSMREDGWE